MFRYKMHFAMKAYAEETIQIIFQLLFVVTTDKTEQKKGSSNLISSN